MRLIYVTFRKKGIHAFYGAANNPDFADVAYLGQPHRHLFHFKVSIEVFHDDREIEFHQFLNWLESLYADSIVSLNHQSCEMIADALASQIQQKYPNRYIRIDVSEDGECGVECEYPVEVNS